MIGRTIIFVVVVALALFGAYKRRQLVARSAPVAPDIRTDLMRCPDHYEALRYEWRSEGRTPWVRSDQRPSTEAVLGVALYLQRLRRSNPSPKAMAVIEEIEREVVICHCGAPVVGESDATPGPAARVLCERCFWVRCDAFPGECKRPDGAA